MTFSPLQMDVLFGWPESNWKHYFSGLWAEGKRGVFDWVLCTGFCSTFQWSGVMWSWRFWCFAPQTNQQDHWRKGMYHNIAHKGVYRPIVITRQNFWSWLEPQKPFCSFDKEEAAAQGWAVARYRPCTQWQPSQKAVTAALRLVLFPLPHGQTT